MCVYKNHAFIYFRRPPSWSGTITIDGQVRLVCFFVEKRIKYKIPFAREANSKQIKENCLGFCFPLVLFSVYTNIYIYFHIYIYIYIYVFIYGKRKWQSFICSANRNGKRKFVFLGWETINGNQRLLFQQKCPSVVITFSIRSCTSRNPSGWFSRIAKLQLFWLLYGYTIIKILKGKVSCVQIRTQAHRLGHNKSTATVQVFEKLSPPCRVLSRKQNLSYRVHRLHSFMNMHVRAWRFSVM
jgi:hypothetical protein